MRVAFQIGAGSAVPTQLFFVPLLALAPAPSCRCSSSRTRSRAARRHCARPRTSTGSCSAAAIRSMRSARGSSCRSGPPRPTATPLPVLLLAFPRGSPSTSVPASSRVARVRRAAALQLRVQVQVSAVGRRPHAARPAPRPRRHRRARGAARALPRPPAGPHGARRQRRIERHDRLKALERERPGYGSPCAASATRSAANLDLNALLRIVTARRSRRSTPRPAARACSGARRFPARSSRTPTRSPA